MAGERRRRGAVLLAAGALAVCAGVVVAIGAGTGGDAPPAEGAPPAALDLPRIPWEGGPAYWERFDDAAEWADPDFFPIGIWYAGISSTEEADWDKAHGINTYLGMWEETPFSIFEDNDVYWVGGGLNDTFDEDSPHWPGVVLDDEVDGRFPPEEGFAHLGELSAAEEGSGKVRYANFTQLVIGSDLDLDAQERYVNDFTDVVSVDMYWYTIPFCDWSPYRGGQYAEPVPQDTCRTASSYGRSVSGLTIRDGADGRLQPRWMFIENLNGLSGQDHLGYIEPGQLKGAAMAAVINEARGLVWFNQSFTGPCQSSNVIRSAQLEGEAWCGAAQIEAMGEVNNLIHDLAAVLNTQSYEWDFGDGLDTMLKATDDEVYVFAMTDGGTGRRSFTLPDGVRGSGAEVIGEDRTIDIRNGAFSDEFAHEYDYRVYRIAR